jgi:hypothetical protein
MITPFSMNPWGMAIIDDYDSRPEAGGIAMTGLIHGVADQL